jgi:hypothetical protein
LKVVRRRIALRLAFAGDCAYVIGIDIWPDDMAVSPSLICQARVQTLPNIDEPASSRARGVA